MSIRRCYRQHSCRERGPIQNVKGIINKDIEKKRAQNRTLYTLDDFNPVTVVWSQLNSLFPVIEEATDKSPRVCMLAVSLITGREGGSQRPLTGP